MNFYISYTHISALFSDMLLVKIFSSADCAQWNFVIFETD